MAAAMTETARAPVPRPLQPPTATPSSSTPRARTLSASSTGPTSTPPAQPLPAMIESTTPRTSPSLQLRDGQWTVRPTLTVTPLGLPDGVQSSSSTATPGTTTPTYFSPSAPGTSTSQILPRHQSVDTRRVRSDARPPSGRQMSITMGKRPSIVTGGYESSSADEIDGDGDVFTRSGMWEDIDMTHPPHPRPVRGLSIGSGRQSPGAGGVPGTASIAGIPPAKRHRAHSHNAHHAQSPHSPQAVAPPLSAGTLQGLGLMNSPHPTPPTAAGRRRAQSLMSPTVDPASTPSSSRRSSRLLRPPLGSPLAPHRVASASGIASGLSAGGSSPLHSRMPSDSAHSRSTSMRSVNSIPEGQQYEATSSNAHSLEGSIRESVRKQKLRDSTSRKRAFGTSLGLGAAPREGVLTADQLQNLLHDVDVSSAIQRMNAPMLSSRRLSHNAPPQRDLSPSPIATSTSTDESPQSTTQARMPAEPYLVSAPPPLTSGDWAGRDRSSSGGSSIAPPVSGRNLSPGRVRTASHSTTLSDTDRELMAYQQHVVSPIIAGDSDEDGTPQQYFPGDEPPTAATASSSGSKVLVTPATDSAQSGPSEPASVRSDAPSVPSAAKRHTSGRRRISGLFGTMRKKRGSSPPPTPPPPAPPPAPPVQAAPAQTKQPAQAIQEKQNRELEIRTREQEMRIAEQARREEELAQERMYRATMQVRSHPASQKRAHKAALHLDAYYAVIQDGLENPPKFNPLAVLRWNRRMEEQRAAKTKWEAEQEATSRASGSMSALSLPGSISSPQSDAFRMSLDAAARAVSPNNRSVTSTGEPIIAPGWHYSLPEVEAYTACKGKIEFFIPPIEALSPSPMPASPEEDRTRKVSRPSSTMEIRSRQSSVGGEGEVYRGDDMQALLAVQMASRERHATQTSPMLVADTSLEDGNMSSLSRTPSFDINRSATRGHRVAVSTSGLPSNSLGKSTSSLQVLKAPFERLGNVARRNISMSVSANPVVLDGDDGNDSARRGPGWLSVDAPPAAEHRGAEVTQASPLSATEHARFRDKVRRGLNTVTNGGGRHDNTTGTSDDEPHGFRKLFRGSSKTRASGHAHMDSSTSRVDAIRALENIVDNERQLRYEITSSRHPTDRERQAQEDLLKLENQIYHERKGLLSAAHQRVDEMAMGEAQMGQLVTHFLSALDQARSTFHTAADVDVAFQNLDDLRRPRKIMPIAVDDESADSVAPLRGEESDRGGFSAGFSDSRNGRPVQRARKQSLAPSIPNLAFVYGGYNRRSRVDPDLGEPIGPIQRVERACQRARDCSSDMMVARQNATATMQAMVDRINDMIKQKDNVRKWTSKTMDDITRLKDERDTLRLKIRGGIRPRLARLADIGIDRSLRLVLGLVGMGYRLYRYGTGLPPLYRWATFLSVLLAIMIHFYVTGDSSDAEAAAAVAAAAAAASMATLASMASASATVVPA